METIDSALARWTEAIASSSPRRVADCYDENAVLLGTFCPRLRKGRESIGGYFEDLLRKKGLCVEVLSHHQEVLGSVGFTSGLYTFRYLKGEETMSFPARFTFVYKADGPAWSILTHHSSVLPKDPH